MKRKERGRAPVDSRREKMGRREEDGWYEEEDGRKRKNESRDR